jgi:hypothetical protein
VEFGKIFVGGRGGSDRERRAPATVEICEKAREILVTGATLDEKREGES